MSNTVSPAAAPFNWTTGQTIGELESRLAQANEELTQFNYHVSHDLVAPISSARGLLHLMQHDLEAGITEELPELLSEAQSQLVRLDSLVADLMSLARAGTSEQRIENIDLRPLLDDIVASMSMHALELETSVTLKTDQPLISSDRVRVQQILTNLISNARKFVDPEELAPEITVKCDHTDSGIYLRVIDNGLGIDPTVAKKLFGLFTRGTSQHAGHGLGLYIVEKHVSRLAGTVRVTNYCKPTVFEVFLPYHAADALATITDKAVNNTGIMRSV